jgi:DNA-binding response OmpR family regulator
MKVLVADVAPEGARMAALLSRHEVTTATTLSGALAALAGRCDVLVTGVRFDDSRMFDLLREVRADARLKDMRVICLIPSRTLEAACLALEAIPLLDSEATSVAALISGGTPSPPPR